MCGDKVRARCDEVTLSQSQTCWILRIRVMAEFIEDEVCKATSSGSIPGLNLMGLPHQSSHASAL